jgi:hypothetical protein
MHHAQPFDAFKTKQFDSSEMRERWNMSSAAQVLVHAVNRDHAYISEHPFRQALTSGSSRVCGKRALVRALLSQSW